MNPMSLPRATLFTIGALVVALLGWGALIYTTASYNDAEQRWTAERTALDTQVAELTSARDDLYMQVGQLEVTLAEERKAAGDLAALRAEIDQANARLSDRMTVLGERERDLETQRREEAKVADELAVREERLAEVRDSLNARMGVLREREHDLADRRMQLASLTDEAAQVEGRISAAATKLNQRMGVLGDRDRDLAAANRALAALTEEIDQAEQRHAAATAQLNRRLGVMRDHERQAAELARGVMHADGRFARLQQAAAGAETNLADKRTALAAAEVKLADAERSLSHRGAEFERTAARLVETQRQLAGLEGQVDHALLAKDAGELSARRDTLAKQVAALDQEIERKGPLAASATTLSARVAELEDQLLRLTREREQAAAAVRNAQRELELVQAERDLAGREHARLVEQVDELSARRADTEAALASLNAEVRHQDSVFATLEVLKKEQGFLRELIGAMVDDGSAARERIRDLRQESEALLAQQLELEKQLVGKQTEIQMLDKAIVAKSRSLEGKEPDVSNARAF
jgi:chromosome segregation ATPase